MSIISTTREQTRLNKNGVATIFSRTWHALECLARNFSRNAESRKAERILQSLSDHTLKDMGLVRGDIRAAYAAGRNSGSPVAALIVPTRPTQHPKEYPMNIHLSAAEAEAIQAEQSQQIAWLETMMLIRAYEEKLVELQQHGAPGTCTSVGQEACAVGVVSALDARDRILTNHRSAGHLIARGADVGRLFAEVLGREDGYCKGRSGSLHISAGELGVVLTSTIVGGELSMAPGVALAQKMGKGETGGITAVFFGDGATCEGIFHEALNLAVQWQLPLLFVCEDNYWQAFVHRDETMPEGAIPQWAGAHGLPVVSVDGNDVEAVHDAASRAVAGIRETGRPCFLHLTTYRQRGHFEPDDQAYVDRAELAHWIENDPIRRLEAQLSAEGTPVADEIGKRVAARIEDAVAFAQTSPWPSANHLQHFSYA